MSDFTCEGDTPFNNHYKGSANIGVWGLNNPFVHDGMLYRTIHHSSSGIFYEPGYIQLGDFCGQNKKHFTWCPEYEPVEGMLYDVTTPEGEEMTLTLSLKTQGEDINVFESDVVSVEFQNLDWGVGYHTYLDTISPGAQFAQSRNWSQPPGQPFCFWSYVEIFPNTTTHRINNVISYDFKAYAVQCGSSTGRIYFVINNARLFGGHQMQGFFYQGPAGFTVSCGNPPTINGGQIFTNNINTTVSPCCILGLTGVNLRVV